MRPETDATRDLDVFTNGVAISADDAAGLARNGVHIVADPIRRLDSMDGRLLAVELASGERIERDAGLIGDEYSDPASTFAESLGVTSSTNEWGMTALDVTETGGTGVGGLYVIGDARTGFSGIVAGATEGAACVEMIVHDIATQRWSSR